MILVMEINHAVFQDSTPGWDLYEASQKKSVMDCFGHTNCTRHIKSRIIQMMPIRKSVDNFIDEPSLKLNIERLLG